MMMLSRLAPARRVIATSRPLFTAGHSTHRTTSGVLTRCFSLSASNAVASSSAKAPEWASNEARTALEGFAERYASSTREGKPVSEYRQVLDANQVHLARLTTAGMIPLGSSSSDQEAQMQRSDESVLAAESKSSALANGVPTGSPLLPAEHLAFFTPRVPSSTLGADGSDTSFNPPGGVFTRRMWAGGSMTWDSNGANDLRVGDEAWERTFVEDAQLKQLGGGRGEMMVVWVRKEFGTERAGPCLIDKRSWVFQRALPIKDAESSRQSSTRAAPSSEADAPPPSPPANLLAPTHLRQAPADLFRYSALTFNAHAIHLSLPWAQHVEGHPDIVVHGPLNLSLLLRKWGRDVAGWHLEADGAAVLTASKGATSSRRLVSVDYRAKRPVYAGIDYWIGFQGKDGAPPALDRQADTHKVVAVLADGSVAMEATVTSKVA